GAAIGMAIRPQVIQPQPPAIVTSGVGTKVHRGVHRPGAAVRGGHGIGPSRRRWSRFAGRLVTQHTARLVRQARKRLGLGGAGGGGGWDRAVAEALEPFRRSLGHTTHSEACASGPQTVEARWSVCAWAALARLGWSDPAQTR